MGCNCSKDSQTCQPRSKDIPIELDVREECTVKDERETTDNTELIGIDIRGIITRALEESLKGYKVYGQAIPPENLKPTRLLEVKRNNKITVTPDSTGTFLTHGLLHTQYDLYAAVNRTTHSVVFLYQWEENGKKKVTWPYFRDPTDGSIIPCVTVDITQALKGSDPVKAVMAELKKILKDGLEWDMHGADNDFTISPKIYWRAIDESSDIKLTYNDSIKQVMKLELV